MAKKEQTPEEKRKNNGKSLLQVAAFYFFIAIVGMKQNMSFETKLGMFFPAIVLVISGLYLIQSKTTERNP